MKNPTRVLAIAALILGASLHSTVRAEVLVITAEHLFNAKSGEMTGPAAVVVRDGRIESVNPSQIPPNAREIRLGDRTLIPGLIDMHTHITMDYFTGDDWVTAPVFETVADWAIRGVIEAGKRADIIAVDSNPLDDIEVMENVRFVMRGGTVYRAP